MLNEYRISQKEINWTPQRMSAEGSSYTSESGQDANEVKRKNKAEGHRQAKYCSMMRIIYNVHEWVLKAAQVPHQSILMVLHRPAKWQYNSLQCIDWPKWQVPKDHLSSKKFGNVISLFEIYVKSSFACLNASCFQNTAADKRGHRRWTRCPGWGVLICGVRHLWAENVERTVKLGQIHSIW